MSSALVVAGTVLPSGESRDLYVVDGRITYKPVAAAERVAEGWIVPGLVDAHCHVGLDEHGPVSDEEAERQALADRDAGTLLIRDAGSAADTRWMDERDDLPRIIRAGRHLARPRRYIRNYAHEIEPAELPAYVAQEAQRSDGWVKLVGDWIDRDVADLAPCWPLDALRAAIDTAHAHGARVTAHCFGEESLPDLFEAGIDCIEHGTGLTTDLIDQMVVRGIALVPTVRQLENFPGYAAAGEARYPAYAARIREMFDRRKEVLGAAHEAGVAIYAGTDAGGVLPHGLIAEEIRELAGIGMSAAEALGAASWHARPWLGRPGGNLDEGDPADFVVYDANPLDDLAVIADPRRVVLRGVVIS
ncbi:MAG: amidohydrolase family protein [Actinomycetota bacterium]|nr:amidohydrolase family protein [Actinomycetota bacterium]